MKTNINQMIRHDLNTNYSLPRSLREQFKVGNEAGNEQRRSSGGGVSMERLESYASLKRKNTKLKEQRGYFILGLAIMTVICLMQWHFAVQHNDTHIMQYVEEVE